MHYVQTVIVEQSALIREGLIRILSESRFRVTSACARLHELDGKAGANAAEALILIGLDSEAGLLSEIRNFKSQYQGAKIIVLSERFSIADLVAAAEGGADGYFSKMITSESLLKSLDLVLLGATIIPSGFLPSMLGHAYELGARSVTTGAAGMMLAPPPAPEELPTEDADRLSNREKTILRYLTQGASNKTIARELEVAEATVKVHIKGILRKIRVRNRTQAAVWALSCKDFANE